MSVFTSDVTKTLSVPHDSPNTVEIRRLPPKWLREAQRVSQKQSASDFQAMGGAAFLRDIQAMNADKGEAVVADAAKADPLLTYDSVTLIYQGVVAWSYDKDCDKVAVIEDLDDQTQDWLAREILRLSKPDLFETTETLTKND